MRRDHHHRHGRVDAAQRYQPGQAAGARHGQIQQDEIDILAGDDERLGALEIAGLVDGRDITQAGQRLPQRSTKQRMVVGNDECIA